MKRAQLLTPWVAANPAGATLLSRGNHPKILDDYTLQSYKDVTGQPAANIVPEPNLCVVEITCDDSVMSQIEASAEYGDGVLWVEDA